jgi:alpha-L-arabinofuranosidase
MKSTGKNLRGENRFVIQVLFSFSAMPLLGPIQTYRTFLCNIDPNKNVAIEIELRGANKLSIVKGEIITSSAMNDYNDFDKPEKVYCRPFSGHTLTNNFLKILLPSKSIVTVEMKRE